MELNQQPSRPVKKIVPILIMAGSVLALLFVGYLYYVSKIRPVTTSSTPGLHTGSNVALGEEELFSQLVTQKWCNGPMLEGKDYGGLAPTAISYTFRSDGTYTFSYFSDYPEAEGEGRWNFVRHDDGTGHLLLSQGAYIHFTFLTDGTLNLGNTQLSKCEALAVTATRTQLPKVQIPTLVTDLASHSWVISETNSNVNTGVLQYTPTGIRFSDSGEVFYTYRHGECTEHMYFSMGINHPDDSWDLEPVKPRSTFCDSRDESSFVPSKPKFLEPKVDYYKVSGNTMTYRLNTLFKASDT